MTQNDRNQLKWENPSNWSSRSLLGFYFSKSDKRIVVPKAMPSLGWTLNLAHPAGALSLIGFFLLPTLVLLVLLMAR